MPGENASGLSPWISVEAFNELSGDGCYRSGIGEASESIGYAQDVDDLNQYQPLLSTFRRDRTMEMIIWWAESGAFESSIRSELFTWADGTDPFVNCLMAFLSGPSVTKDFVGLSTVIGVDDLQAIDSHRSKYGFGADLTWTFRRDPSMQANDFALIFSALQERFPGLPQDL
jgi:hypothetical protein